MKDHFRSSIRSKLIFLAVLAFLPTVLLSVFNFWHQRRLDVEGAKGRMARLLDFAVIHEEEEISETDRILAALAEVPFLRKGGKPASEFLARLLKVSTEYTNFGVLRPDGQMIASALPLKAPLNVSDRSYFQDALRKKSFTSGQFIVDRITGKPVVAFGRPVLDRQGKVTAVLFASLALDHVTKFESDLVSKAPGGSIFARLDRHGNVLTSYPELQPHWREHPRMVSFFERISKEKRGIFQTVDADDVERLYLFSPFRGSLNKEEGYALLGIPTKALFAEANDLLLTNMAVLFVIMVFFLEITWYGGNTLIIRPARMLADAAKRMGAGDLSARTGMPPTQGELGQLGRALDEMAAELEKKGEALFIVNTRLKHILKTVPAVVYVCSVPEKAGSVKGYPTVFVSDKITDLFGYEAREVLGNPAWWLQNIHPEDLAVATDFGTLFDQGKAVREYRFRAKDGSYRWVLDQVVLVRDKERTPVEIVGSWVDISARKRAEEVLRESEARYRMLFEQAGDYVLLLEAVPDGPPIIADANEAALTAHGYSREEVLGRPITLLEPELSHEDNARRHEQIGKSGRVASFQVGHHRKDGSTFDAEVQVRYVRFCMKDYYLSVERDITERNRAEAALRESEERFRDLVEHSQDLICTHDLEGRILSANPWAAAILGIPPDALLKTNLRDLLVPETRHEFGRYMEEIRMHGAAQGLMWVQTRNGERRLWEYKNTLRTEGVAEPIVRGMAQDITERKRSEDALKESEERFRLVLDNTNDGILLIDAESLKIEMGNRKICEMLGCGEEEILRLRVLDIHPEKNLPDVLAGFQEARDGIRTTTDIPLKTKDDSVFFADITSSSIDFKGKRLILEIVRDLTNERMLQKQLLVAQKMESVGTLAGGIAHDFNNALTGIVGFGELLRGRVGGDEQASHDLDEILRCAERAATLTRQLLTFARRQIIEPVNLNLSTLVADLMGLIGKAVGEHIEVKMTLERNVPTIHADPGQIEQVIMNLCLNAKDAMSGGGQLLVETGDVRLEEEHVHRHPYMKTGKYALLTVSDTGVGMDEKTRERVFDPFFTTKEPDKGTGLGLAMVYGIVKQHGGFIHLYSEPGIGTTFKVYFPAIEAPAYVIQEKRREEKTRGGMETILLAEDEESIRLFIERILKDLGYTVLVARNGEEAIDIFMRNRGIALALLDVVMPRMGGKEAFENMRQANPDLKVIFMSGYSANAIHNSFVLNANTPFLQKPFGPTILARKIREVLDTQRFTSGGANDAPR